MILDDFDISVTANEVSVWSYTDRLHLRGTDDDGRIMLRLALGDEQVYTSWEEQKDGSYRHKIAKRRLRFGLNGKQMSKGNVAFARDGLEIVMKVPDEFQGPKITASMFDDDGRCTVVREPAHGYGFPVIDHEARLLEIANTAIKDLDVRLVDDVLKLG